MSAHNRRGARLGAMLLSLALCATPLRAHAQAATRAWSTYLGGSGNDRVTGIIQSPFSRDVVVGGWTNSRDFPPRTGTGNDPARDAFLAVFTSDGLIRGTPFIFGGTGEDLINAVAIGDQGQIYAVGMTRTATMPGFTTRYRSYGGLEDGFLARFTADGAPEWIMYLDSPGSEMATGVTVSGSDIYVTGFTDSCAFLGTTGTCYGGREGFVVKVNNTSVVPSVLWTRLILGNLDDFANKPLVSGSTVVVAGSTNSTAFAHGAAVQNFFQGGNSDAMAVGLDAATGAVSWLQYLGGVGDDYGTGVVAGANGEVVVVGTAEVASQGKNILATWIDSTGGQIRNNQRYGGTADEVVSSAAVDASGNIYIGGRTNSTDFPLAREFDRTTEAALPPQEGFIMVLPAQGGPGWASYVGGNSLDDVLSLSILQRRLVVAGETSSSADLITGGGYDSTSSTPPDGFIVAVDTDTTPPLPGTVYDRPADDLVPEDIPTQTSRDSISANWSGFVDSDSGVERYEFAIGTSPGAQDVMPFTATSISLQSSFTKTGLTLSVGRTYYTTVRAINGAGLTSTATSNGVLVVPVGTDGGTNGGTDGGVDGGTNGGTDGGTGEEPEEGTAPLMGWSCTAADAGLPMLAGLLALMLLARRRGSQSR